MMLLGFPSSVGTSTEPQGPGAVRPGPKGHTYSPWFKSTLLLFLRLLLSTKKKMACQTFFFSFLPRKTGHSEWYITDLQTWRELSGRTAAGSVKNLPVSLPSKTFGFLLPCLPEVPSGALPIPDRSVHQGPGSATVPSQSDDLTDTEPNGSGVDFLWRHSVACSNNKLVAIKADAVFS